MENPLSRDLDHVLAHTESLWSALRGERLFITGGTGFVGTWLTESLVWANRRLSLGLSAVLLTRNPEAFRRRSPHLAYDPVLELWAGDAATFRYPEGTFGLVIHAATENYGRPEVANPASTLERDVAATRRVLKLASSRGAKRLLFTSSGAVYGKQPPELTHIHEDYAGAPLTTDSTSAYGQAKRISEFLCCTCAQVSGFDAVVARLFTFIGPTLPVDAHYAVGNFIRDAMRGGPVQINGDGTPYRSYLYAADLAIWLWTLLMRGNPGTAYNVGSSEEITISDLAHRVIAIVAPDAHVRIARQPVAGAPAPRYVPSTAYAASLGLQSWIGLDEGVRRTFEWHRMKSAGSFPLDANLLCRTTRVC